MSNTTNMSLPSELLAFRNAYLQCIAACWADSRNEHNFLSKAKLEFAKNLSLKLNEETEEDIYEGVLPVLGPGLQKPIVTLDLVNITYGKSSLFQKYLPEGLSSLLWRVDVYVLNYFLYQQNTGKDKHLLKSKRYVPYNPNSINGWIGYSDVMVVKIPNRPGKESDHTVALSAYYELFNTLFGNSENPNFDHVPPVTSNKLNEEKLEPVIGKLGHISNRINNQELIQDVLLGNPSSDLGDGSGSQFLNFGAVLMTIIAACWKDPNYLNYITNKHLLPLGTDSSSLDDEYVNFTNVWNFTILFQQAEPTNSQWNADEQKWTNVENNVILLNYPIPPGAEGDSGEHIDPALRALAFSQYNNTGPQYPLTCPC